MTRRALLSIAIAAAVMASGPVASASAVTIPTIPNLPGLPRAPKITSYKATLDVAGYLTVRQTRDDTRDCSPGRDAMGVYETLLELGRPRPVRVTVLNGLGSSGPAVNPGGVIHRAEVTTQRLTNYCPPIERAPDWVPPACKRLQGKLRAFLAPTADPSLSFDDPTPLVHPVSLALQRIGGGNQGLECLDFGTPLRPAVGAHALDMLEMDLISMVVPTGFTDVKLRTLKKGAALRRSIRLNGACDHVLIRTGSATAADLNDISESCTVTGRIYLQVKRIG